MKLFICRNGTNCEWSQWTGLIRRVTRLDIDGLIERPVRLEVVDRLDQAVELLLVGTHGHEYHARPSLEDRAEVNGAHVDIELFWPLHYE